tara:strand:- start:12 stop:626 length:615 start_codon:yes stop_codon:yes gene_type:complete
MGSSFDGTRQSVNRAQQVRISAASGREQRRRTARAASAAETEALTLTLTGCGSGCGVGLDGDNCVDMLKPGMPAAEVLQMGDRVVSWNGVAMMEDGSQRLLKDVVTPAESHEIVVERVRPSPAGEIMSDLAGLSAMAQAAMGGSGGAASVPELESSSDTTATEAAAEAASDTIGESVNNSLVALDPKLAAIFADYAEPPDLEDS